MTKLKLTSDFLTLDVKKGRTKLAEHFEKRPLIGYCPEEMRVPITITGYISGVWGNDDGESREFTVDVQSLKLGVKA